jgi:ATP/maltotriose-dependent transcriptional regulator MalT
MAETAAPELKRANQAAWFHQLAIEHDNMRAALRWSLDVGEVEVGLRIAIALARFWEVHGHRSEARRWFEDLFDLPGFGNVTPSLRAAAAAHAGYFAQIQGDYAMGDPLLEEGLRLARATGALSTAAFALFGLGQAAHLRGDIATARPLMLEALRLGRDLEDGWATARALLNLGDMERMQGHLERARALHEEGLLIAERCGERRIGSTLRVALGMVALAANDFPVAHAHLESGLATKRDLGDHVGSASAVRGLGWVAYEHGDYRRACQLFGEALSEGSWGFDDTVPSALVGFGSIAYRVGCAERAVRLFGAAAAQIRALDGDGRWMARMEQRRPIAEARRSLGRDATRLWSEGLTHDRDQVVAQARAVAEHVASIGQHGSTSGVARSAAVELTRREGEIVRLIATGRTNHEIADALVLSVRTVERHIENAYAKLGVHGPAARAAVAANVARIGVSAAPRAGGPLI